MLLHTLITRWYVFLFLIAFLVIGIRTRGFFRTLLFLVTGYFIAWISEASSIRTGFPYGWYFYIYENLQGEILNWGVPVWDSLSYTFLCFAGMSLAEFLLKTTADNPKSVIRYPISVVALLSSLFVVLLDIIVDPLAHQGDQWFLGKIYYYPNPGFYFDVPLSNFAGWFLVSFVIVGVNVMLDKLLRPTSYVPRPTSLFNRYAGPALYFGIFLFNWGITLWIGAWKLAMMDLVWIAIPGYLFFKCITSPTLKDRSMS